MKTVLLCMSALLVQSIAGRCLNQPPSCGCSKPLASPSCGCSGGSISISNVGSSSGSSIVSVSSPSVVSCGSPIVSNNAPIVVSGPALASSGGDFITTSLGVIVPSGIRVDNNNELYGDLYLSGVLPYLTAVAFEGSFPNSGVASIAYGCGDGEIAITDVIGGAAQSASYGGAILPAANYNNYNSAILSAPSCGPIVQPCNCGCA